MLNIERAKMEVKRIAITDDEKTTHTISMNGS